MHDTHTTDRHQAAMSAAIDAWAVEMASGTILEGTYPRAEMLATIEIGGAQRTVRLTFEMLAEDAEPAASVDDLRAAVDFSLTKAEDWLLAAFKPGSDTVSVPVAEIEAVLATCSATLARG